MMFFDEFILRGVLAALAIAIVAGPLGCFILWRRMAYLGDAAAHASLLGVALALLLSLPVFPGVLLIVAIVAIGAIILSRGRLAADSLLGVAAHSGLAFGIVGLALAGERAIDLHAYLFGEVLAVNWFDVALIFGATAAVGGVTWLRWRKFVTVSLSGDLAAAAGISTKREDLIIALMLAIVIAISIKIVGALLITALLILPAAAARFSSRTPEAMAFTASGFGASAVILGFWASDQFNIPTGPTIICAAAAIFAFCALISALRQVVR